jgi:pyruvate dehydrogenase E2 component (dihydrolipoamide acetyltransferase)
MAEEGDDLSGAADFAAKAESESPSSEPKPDEAPKKEEPVKKEEGPKPSAPTSSGPAAKEELKSGDVIFATPIAKKIALERGIPLSKVKGTGPDGRIIRADVEAYKGAASVTSASTFGGFAEAAAAVYTDSPLTNMRKTIGTRLTESKTSIPHYYVTVDIDMGRTLKLREVFNKQLSEKEDPKAKLSVNDFIVKASSLALRDVPEANSAWLGDQIRQCVNLLLHIFKIMSHGRAGTDITRPTFV